MRVDTGYCDANVIKWMINRFLAPKLKLQDYDRVFNLVNLNNTHWTLLVRCSNEGEYYDHFYSEHQQTSADATKYLETMLQWVKDDVLDKSGW